MKKSVWTPAKKKEIEDVVGYWFHEFALPPMIFDLTFSETNEETPHGGDSAMCVQYAYPYRQLEITVFPPVAKYDREKLRLTVLHEMLHTVFARLKYMRRDVNDKGWRTLEEEAVDLIAHVMNNNIKRNR